jgi:hypothetical protein
MTITWKRTESVLRVGEREFPCSCLVRTLENSTRRRDEIIRTIPGAKPYMPVRFPVGTWNVARPQARSDPYKRPFYIPTDAWAKVPVWNVAGGLYREPSAEFDRDYAYGIHHSTSKTTQGCIKIEREEDLLELVGMINAALDAKETVKLEVFE